MAFLRPLFSAIGSHSSDIPDTDSVENPLPPCPNSPNCIRITQTIEAPMDSVFEASQNALDSMNPEKITAHPDSYSISTVFKVVVFRDDLSVQLTKKDASTTYLHIRSSSRVGFSDLGVNTRRVKRFLKRLGNLL